MGFGGEPPVSGQRTKRTKSPRPAATQIPETLIVGSGEWHNISWCPVARTLSGYSQSRRSVVYMQTRCKRWGCPHCGRRRIISLAKKVDRAGPSKFITLTVDPGRWENPREAFKGTSRPVSQLITKLRRLYGPIEYLKVLETTKSGWPHYHLCVISDYLPQATISALWNELTGAHIVDIRQVKKVKDVYWYMVKYLAKQTHVPWTNRRISWTRKFFAACPKPEGMHLELAGVTREKQHPQQVMEWQQRGRLVRRLTADAWELVSDNSDDWDDPGFAQDYGPLAPLPEYS